MVFVVIKVVIPLFKGKTGTTTVVKKKEKLQKVKSDIAESTKELHVSQELKHALTESQKVKTKLDKVNEDLKEEE